MEYLIKVSYDKKAAEVRIEGNCDDSGYGLMYIAVSRILKYGKRMKITIIQDEITTHSIKKTLKFVRPSSAKIFYNRLPKKKA